VKYPCQESNLALQLRKLLCAPPHSKDNENADKALIQIFFGNAIRIGSRRETQVGVEPTWNRVAAGRLSVWLPRHEQYPRQESNLDYNLRTVACVRHTPRT
jgi:hypothetical protein